MPVEAQGRGAPSFGGQAAMIDLIDKLFWWAVLVLVLFAIAALSGCA